MKKIFVFLLLTTFSIAANHAYSQTVDSAAMLKTQKNIESNQKDAAKLQGKVDKHQRRIERQQNKIAKSERRRDRKLKKISKDQKKLQSTNQ